MLTPKDYEFALMSQSACNASGLVHDLHEVVTKIWEEARVGNHGTDWVNNHPIMRLYAEQIYFLCGRGDYSKASETCRKESKVPA